MQKIRIGIVGYGNIGKGVELAILQNTDMELAGIFTRRNKESLNAITKNVKVYQIEEASALQDSIDVMILCGSSAADLPEQTPYFANLFHVVDSFDTHAKIPQHWNAVNTCAKASGKVGIISVGWDPGLFSIYRLYGNAILPQGADYTFWGRGVSQGHSDAIRQIKGVKDAKQYTVPIETSVELVRNGVNPNLSTRQKHTRDCYVVVEDGADQSKIEQEIKSMPNYFADYDTTVTFISEEELQKNHAGIPHGGFVIRSGKTGNGTNQHIMEYRLKLDSNPEFTSSVLVASARAAIRLANNGICGAKTILDIPPAYLCTMTSEELMRTLL